MPWDLLLTPEMAVAAGFAVAAGLMRGFAGFGSAMLMAPIFAILFGPAQMVAIILVMELAVTVQLLPGARGHVEWRFVGPMAAAAAVGMPVGSFLLLALDPELLTRATALIVVAFAALLFTGWRYHGPKRLGITLGLGSFSGVMMATTSMGGPPVLLYMLSGPDKAITNRANIIVYFAVSEVILLLVLLSAGIVGWTAVWLGAALTPPFMAAAWIGSRLFRQSSEQLYRRVALVFLLGVGIFGLLR